MRATTVLSIAVIGLSSAALAQVGQTTTEQKLGNDVATAENVTAPPPVEQDVAPADTMTTPTGNVEEAAPPAGEPTATSDAPPQQR